MNQGQTAGPGGAVDQTGVGASRTGPHVLHFTPWKEKAEIEAGRLEFFKQTLTIALAGIGGLAAVVIDADKVPDDWLSAILLIIFAMSAIVLVIASSDGISTYANYLRDVEKASGDPQNVDLQTQQEASEKSILTHAKWTISLSWIAAATLIVFAIVRILQPSVGAEAAMRKAREIVSKQPGNPIPQSLDHFQTVGEDYVISYITGPSQVRYTVTINRHTNSIRDVAPKP